MPTMVSLTEAELTKLKSDLDIAIDKLKKRLERDKIQETRPFADLIIYRYNHLIR
jgi:hypothetical protein